MKDTTTIIVGAGAVLDFEHKGIIPSVQNITKEVLKLNIHKVEGGERPLLRELYNHVYNELNKVSGFNYIKPPQLNFENLLAEKYELLNGDYGVPYISDHWPVLGTFRF